MLALVSAGAILVVRDRAITVQNRGLLLVWGCGIAAIVFALTPLPWARYYLPGITVCNDYGCLQPDNHDEMDMAARRNTTPIKT